MLPRKNPFFKSCVRIGLKFGMIVGAYHSTTLLASSLPRNRPTGLPGHMTVSKDLSDICWSLSKTIGVFIYFWAISMGLGGHLGAKSEV